MFIAWFLLGAAPVHDHVDKSIPEVQSPCSSGTHPNHESKKRIKTEERVGDRRRDRGRELWRRGLTAKGLTSSAPPSSKGLSYFDLPAIPVRSPLLYCLLFFSPSVLRSATRIGWQNNRLEEASLCCISAVGGRRTALHHQLRSRTCCGDQNNFSVDSFGLPWPSAFTFYIAVRPLRQRMAGTG